MEGTSISNNFILYSENLKSDDLKKINYNTNCSVIQSNDDYFIRYIVRIALLKYFTLLSKNVLKNNNDYVKINSKEILQKSETGSNHTLLGIQEVYDNVTDLSNKTILNLDRNYSGINKILSFINIFSTDKYLNYYLNVEKTSIDLEHILTNDNLNDKSQKLIEQLLDSNILNNYSKINKLTIYWVIFKFLITNGDTISKNKYLKLIPDNYKFFLIFSILLIIIAPFILWNKNMGCNVFQSLSNFKANYFLIMNYISLVIYLIIYSSIVYYIFIKIIYKRIGNNNSSIFDLNNVFKMFNFRNFVLLIISIISYNVLDYYSFSGFVTLLFSIQRPILSDVQKNIGLMKQILYKFISFTSSNVFEKCAQPLKFILLMLSIYLLYTSYFDSFLKFLNIGNTSDFFNEINIFIIFLIIIIYVITWFFLNFSSERNSIYKLLLSFLGLGAIYVFILTIYAYGFLNNILDKHCNNINIFKKKDYSDFHKVFMDKFLKPSAPFIILLILMYLYPKSTWIFFDKVLFLFIATIYFFYGANFNPVIGSIIFIVFLLTFVFKFSNIIGIFK